MANLVALTPCDGLLPREIGSVTLTEVTPAQITSVAPFAGKEDPVSDAMTKALGVGFPAPNRMVSKGKARVLWCARGQALVMGPSCPPLKGAAVVDHSDAWAIVELKGAGVEDILARLVPLDLRAATFKRGHTARTLLGHMTANITRTGSDRFEVMVFRSMAKTLVTELTHAAEGVAARA